MNNIHLKKVIKNDKTYTYYSASIKKGDGKYKLLTSPTKEGLIRKIEIIEGKNINYNLRLNAPSTIKDLFNEYLKTFIEPSRSLATFISYKADLKNHILPFFENYDYSDINTIKIQEFYNYLINDKKLSASSANKVYLIIRETFEYATEKGIFYANPCNKTIKKKTKEHRFSSPIKPEYLSKLFELVENDKYSNIYKVMLYTALRRGEALGIKIEDINLIQKTIFIHQQVNTFYIDGVKSTIIQEHTKTHLSRVLPVSDDTIKFIKDELEKQHLRTIRDPSFKNTNNLLFTDETGKMIEPDKVSSHFKYLAKLAGCPNARLHDLRHTAANVLMEETGNIYAVQRQLGHATPVTTENYLGPSSALMKEAADKVSNALNNALNALNNSK